MTLQASHAQGIAITLDDLPYVMPSRTSPQDGLEIAQKTVQTLAKHGITATGFVVGQQITKDAIPALDVFARAGHQIGNHSWSHGDYGTQSRRTFARETRRTHRALTPWVTQPLYYRFPFLRTGETPRAKRRAQGVLDDLGYRNVPVTIDNDEWQFNAGYMDALEAGDTDRAAQIAAAYLAHMKERSRFFQSLAQDALGRDVKHILLLHMNRINADHLDALLTWYAQTGWHFITVDDALTDPLYAMPDLYAGPRGLSQIERVMGRKAE